MSGGLWRRFWLGVRRIHERPEWLRAVGPDWADRIMSVPVTDRFHAKQGRSTGRWVIGPTGARVVAYLKRHYRLGRWRSLLAVLWPGRGRSPAFQEWHHLEWARSEGLSVPRALAACEYVGPWGRLQSFLAVEELAGMLPLHEAIPLAGETLAPAMFTRWKRTLAVELARMTRILHDRRRFHKDLYLCHFFIPREDTACLPSAWAGRVHLIDFHRLARHRWTWWRWRAKDLGQLLYSSEIPGVGLRERLSFWRAYLGRRTDNSSRWLRRHALLKARAYRRHNRKVQQARASGRAA